MVLTNSENCIFLIPWVHHTQLLWFVGVGSTHPILEIGSLKPVPVIVVEHPDIRFDFGRSPNLGSRVRIRSECWS